MARVRAVGRVKRPTGIDAAGDDGHQRPNRGEHVDVPAQQIEPREGQVFGPDHQRQAKIAQHGRHDRHQKEEHHNHAVGREAFVIGVGRN